MVISTDLRRLKGGTVLERLSQGHIRQKKTGLLIRDAIMASGITIEGISVLLELSTPRVIYEWMSGNKLPSLENLVNLSLMFDVKIEDLVALR